MKALYCAVRSQSNILSLWITVLLFTPENGAGMKLMRLLHGLSLFAA